MSRSWIAAIATIALSCPVALAQAEASKTEPKRATVKSALPMRAASTPAGPVVKGDAGKRMDDYLKANDFSGGALVVSNGEIVLYKGYGMADREKKIPYAATTVYPIGSITKQFTAAAILKLEMQAKLKVEDGISKFLGDVPDDKKAITIHHLLTHTSGLDSDFAGDYDLVGRDEYVKKVLASKLRFDPGEGYYYANSGYSLLGAIVEKASGMGYEAFLQKELFAPAGMKDTGYKVPRWNPDSVAIGYRPAGRWGTILEKPWLPDGPGWALRANGGIHSTLADMYRWSVALDGNKVLSDAERKKAFTSFVAEGPNADSYYGYGWTIFTTPWNTRMVAHDGGNGIYSADFRRYVDDDMVILTASNDSRMKAVATSSQLSRLFRGEAADPSRVPSAVAKKLGDSPHHAAVRAYFDAHNSGDVAKMRAFRASGMKPNAKMTDAERDEIYQRIYGDLGKLEPTNVTNETPQRVTVAVASSKEPMPIQFTFQFGSAEASLIEGISVLAGDGP